MGVYTWLLARIGRNDCIAAVSQGERLGDIANVIPHAVRGGRQTSHTHLGMYITEICNVPYDVTALRVGSRYR